MRKYFIKQINRSKNYENRKNVENKIDKEIEKSKEFKNYTNLIKKRGVIIKDKKGKIISTNLSYMKDDWSNPNKVLNQMIKDKKIEDNYIKKKSAIGKKYLDDYRGALLKDLNYEDTKRGREYLKKINI